MTLPVEILNSKQGWELALWFFVRMARFEKKKRANRSFAFVLKSDKSKMSQSLFSLFLTKE